MAAFSYLVFCNLFLFVYVFLDSWPFFILVTGEEFDFGESDEEEEEEDLTFASNNGKPEIKAVKEKPVVAEKAKESKGSAAGMQKVKIVEPTKDEKPEDDDSEDDDSDEDGSSDGDMMDEDDDSDSEDVEETPKKVVSGKKRGAESAIKTPVSQKKAKRVTPQKTDGKSGHVATPHPSKQAGKTPASKADKKTPKSGGVHSCGPCNKGFSSESALQAHTKAKHSAGK
ncbi:hypothetical protein LIER_36033 [Lithospermum erythrorhizon]|uniref:C2H2-type domain-containing protein n=1 Tax=Lithospermum erythrorhizon TaxID=34254 RepID=A0AAV3P2I1_LITER